MADRSRDWGPSNGWFVFLIFAGLGMAGAYATNQGLVMVGVTLLGAFVVAAVYRRRM
jgi:hypothetical protein